MELRLYDGSQREEWDRFVRRSKNGTFLFIRDYMDYHSDRFRDHSLVARNEHGVVVAALPANREASRLVSHGGLTYGGFVTDEQMKLTSMLALFQSALSFLRQEGIQTLIYKTVPYIYHTLPADEDRYALFLCRARLTRCDALTVIRGGFRPAVQERRRRGAKKAMTHGIKVRESPDLEQYWPILTENLRSRYNLVPVHSVQEMTLLQRRFPDRIRLFAAFEGDLMLAGVVIYETQQVAHAQYTAASERGKELGALDLLFEVLVSDVYAGKTYFDFGISTDKGGLYLNRGLNEHKEGFGARAVTHDHFEIDLTSWDASWLEAKC